MRNILTVMSALAVASSPAFALESVTTGSQATQATVGAINSKLDTSIAALQAQIGGIVYCNTIRKFYAPGDPKKDANGCVGTGDYDINMANGANINLAGGQVKGAYSVANQYGGDFTGNTHGLVGRAASYGVVGYGSVGVQGQTVSGWGVYGLATGNGGYGIYGQGTGTSWGGVFRGANYGVYGEGPVYGVYSNGPLCTSATGCSRRGFGGTYLSTGGCGRANPETGACSCPSGFSAYQVPLALNYLYICE